MKTEFSPEEQKLIDAAGLKWEKIATGSSIITPPIIGYTAALYIDQPWLALVGASLLGLMFALLNWLPRKWSDAAIHYAEQSTLMDRYLQNR